MSQQASIGRDYFTAPWCYLIWGAPVAVEVIAGAAYDQGVLSVNLMGTALVLSVGWIGITCFINGRSCRRVHCMIDGIAFPILSFFGALNLLGVISFPWSLYSPVFVAILVGGFVPEFIWGKYLTKRLKVRSMDFTSSR
jgi:hypothetical protein